MTVYRNISLFDGGFIVDLTSDTDLLSANTIEIDSYELLRNNVKGDKVKCVKVLNRGGLSELMIRTNNDIVLFPAQAGGVQPISIGRGSLLINAFLTAQVTTKFVFYYGNVSNYVFDIYPTV